MAEQGLQCIWSSIGHFVLLVYLCFSVPLKMTLQSTHSQLSDLKQPTRSWQKVPSVINLYWGTV